MANLHVGLLTAGNKNGGTERVVFAVFFELVEGLSDLFEIGCERSVEFRSIPNFYCLASVSPD